MTQDHVNIAIKAFIDNFIENPYLHRCEHSLHIALYNELLKRASKNLVFQIDKKTFRTNIVHKEFPGRKKTDTSQKNMVNRTQIDIVVLTENQPIKSLNDFLVGNIDIDYAFELSLEYNIEHLCWDIFKFISGSNRSLNHKNYIIHLYNKNRIKTYFRINKVNSALTRKEGIKFRETDLNKEFELCYYLIQLCIEYSEQQHDEIYYKIIDTVQYFVGEKNKKYNNLYLLDENIIKTILKNMRFLFIVLNPYEMGENTIQLSNIDY